MAHKNETKCKEICECCGVVIINFKNLCYANKKICCNKCCPEEKFKALCSIKNKEIYEDKYQYL